MTNSKPNMEESEEDRLRRLLKVMGDHAVAYKGHFHDMQDKWSEAEALAIKRGRIIERQRERIAELEQKLGITDEL